MNRLPTIVRIEDSHPDVRAAANAEARLFRHYGLDYNVHHVRLNQPAVRVRVLELGEGPTVLMIPGGNGVTGEWVPLMAELRGYRLLAINLVGGGLSDAVDIRTIDYPSLTRNVISSVLARFDLPRVPIIAGSIGGLWALWFALSDPGRVVKMVQCGCPAFVLGTSAPLPMRLLSIPRLNEILFPLAKPSAPEDVRTVFTKLLGMDPEISENLPEVIPELFYHMFHLPTYRLATLSFLETVLTLTGSRRMFQLGAAELGAVSQETLFVWGKQDTFGAPTIGERVDAALSHSTIEFVSTGHVPYLEQPQICASLIQPFLT